MLIKKLNRVKFDFTSTLAVITLLEMFLLPFMKKKKKLHKMEEFPSKNTATDYKFKRAYIIKFTLHVLKPG